MKDTGTDMERIFFDMMLSKSGEDRLGMGFDMFDTAKRLVMASIVNGSPGLSEAQIRVEVLERFYAGDVPAGVMAGCRKNIEALRK